MRKNTVISIKNSKNIHILLGCFLFSIAWTQAMEEGQADSVVIDLVPDQQVEIHPETSEYTEYIMHKEFQQSITECTII